MNNIVNFFWYVCMYVTLLWA